jgi:hypothetical protein
VHLCNWFTEKKGDFTGIEVEIYGKIAKAKCLMADLLGARERMGSFAAEKTTETAGRAKLRPE